MTSFQLVFAAYNLLLGLAVAEVLRGFSRLLKYKRTRADVRIGWLTPLLGLYVLLDLVNFWLLAWSAREQIAEVNYVTLLIVMTFVGVYYLVATLIFPDDPDGWPDFDDWYDREKGMVITGMLVANLGVVIAQGLAPEGSTVADAQISGPAEWITLAAGLIGIALLIALFRVRSRRANAAILVALILIGGGADAALM